MTKSNFHVNNFFKVLKINDKKELSKVSKELKISSKTLKYYNDKMLFPSGEVLDKLLVYTGFSELELKIRLGIIDNNIVEWISKNPDFIINNYNEEKKVVGDKLEAKFTSNLGELYQGDCLEVMKHISDNSIDLIFADPPFNLNKKYESGINDYISEQEYLKWTEEWVLECIRILAPGGSIFVYNLPYWNTHISMILNKYLNFRHWISISMKGARPVKNKLNPEHYSLLYYIKGETPRTFNQQRIPIQTCRHCGGEIRDYGGKIKLLDPRGILVSDIFSDINPVRHQKYKNREANELPLKLLYRVISMASNEGDTIFDPFGGSGTTYVAAEYLKRKWIGVEIGSINDIIYRFKNPEMDIKLLEQNKKESNVLFTEKQIKKRKKNCFWGYEKIQK